MGSIQHIKVYGLDWHLSKSSSVADCLLEPLRPFFSIEFEAWDGTQLPSRFAADSATNGTCIFCQLPPPPDAFRLKDSQVIWVPMWDQAQGYSQQWWNELPKTVRIVAFSEAVAARAQSVGLEVFQLRYYKDPRLLPPASWDEAPCLMYWNRTGLVGPEFLERLCAELNVRTLLFQSQLDPRVPEEYSYRLPSRLGTTIVEQLPTYLPRERYLALMSRSNLYLAPRASEGVGMTFLEAMARGCGVLAYDGPTMNEYIVHRQSGFLLNKALERPTLLDRVMGRLRPSTRKRIARKIDLRQDWACLKATNWRGLGARAREGHLAGHQAWLQSVPRLAAFIEAGRTAR